MAFLPYGEGAKLEPYATTLPDVRQPDDLQHLDVTPNMFGASIAQAKENVAGQEKFAAGLVGQSDENLSRSVLQLGQGATQAGKFLGQVAVDDTINQIRDKVGKLYNGDPTRPAADANGNPILGPDGQPMPDTGFFGTRGADTLRRAAAVEAQVGDLINSGGDSLTTPEQRLLYENEMRRYRLSMADKVGSHIDAQANAYATGVNHDMEQQGLAMVAAHWDNPNIVQAGTDMVIGSRVRQAGLTGMSDVTWARDSAQRDVAKQIVLARLAKDSVGAQQFMEQNRGALGVDYGPLSMEVKKKADEIRLGNIVDTTIADSRSAYSAGAILQDTVSFVKKWEGKVLNAKDDGFGNITVGYGHTEKGLSPGTSITDDQADTMLSADLRKSSEDVDRLVKVPLTPGQRTALVSLQFNTGGLLNKDGAPSQLLSMLNASDYDGAAGEFAKFNHTNGQVVQGLSNRRADEASLFRGQGGGTSPQPPPSYPEYIRTNFEALIESSAQKARADGLDPIEVERARDITRGRLSADLVTLEKAYKADTDAVHRAINDAYTSGNIPATMNDMAKANPQIGKALQRINTYQPAAYQTLTSSLRAAQENLVRPELGYGPAFYDLLQKVHPADGSASLINANDLNGYLKQSGANHITYQGFKALQGEMEKQAKPENKYENDLLMSFLKSAKTQIAPHGDDFMYPDQQQRYVNFLTAFYPMYQKRIADGVTPYDLLDSKNNNYIGSIVDIGKYKPTTDDTAKTIIGAIPVPQRPSGPHGVSVPVNNYNTLKELDDLKTMDQFRTFVADHPEYYNQALEAARRFLAIQKQQTQSGGQ